MSVCHNCPERCVGCHIWCKESKIEKQIHAEKKRIEQLNRAKENVSYYNQYIYVKMKIKQN